MTITPCFAYLKCSGILPKKKGICDSLTHFSPPQKQENSSPQKGRNLGQTNAAFPIKNITQRYPSKCATIIPLSAPQEGSTWMVFYPISPHKLSLKVTPKIRPNSSSKSGQISLQNSVFKSPGSNQKFNRKKGYQPYCQHPISFRKKSFQITHKFS